MGEVVDFKAMAAEAIEATQNAELRKACALGVSPEKLDEIREHERLVAERAERRERRRRRARKVGARLTAADLEILASRSLRSTTALKHVSRWLNSDERFLVLCGGKGTGKTVAGAWAALECGGEVVPSSQLGKRIDPWRHELEDGARRLRMSLPLIVLDDLGTESKSDGRFAEAFFELIDQRQAEGKTMITSNLTRDGLRERYDARVLDRIEHQGRIVEVAGESLRGKR